MEASEEAAKLVRKLTGRGCRFAVRGDRLVVEPARLLRSGEREAIRERKAELLALLCGLPGAGHPSYSIVQMCSEHGVALRIDENGDLVVGKAGAKADEPTQPWCSLLVEIEANLEPVARLVEAGWHLRAGFPRKEHLI